MFRMEYLVFLVFSHCSGPSKEAEDEWFHAIFGGGLKGQDTHLHQGSQSPKPVPSSTGGHFTAFRCLLKNFIGGGQVRESWG